MSKNIKTPLFTTHSYMPNVQDTDQPLNKHMIQLCYVINPWIYSTCVFSYGSDDTLRYTKIVTSWKYRNRYGSNTPSLLLRARLAQLAGTATELWEYFLVQQ